MGPLRVIVNAAAGGAQGEALEAALAVLRTGADVDVTPVDGVEDIDALLAGANRGGLVVAGGDGSMHAAVSRAWQRSPEGTAGIRFALLPLGTGNDLARGLGIPLDPREAARVCLDGTPRRLDLLTTDDGEVAVNAAHAGLGAVAAEAAAEHKAVLGPLAYPLGAVLAGVREDGYSLRVTVDGAPVHDGRTLLVGVSNGPSIGGGALLAPGAALDDGLCDVVVVTALARTARMGFGAALRSGEHLGRDDVAHHRGQVVRITGDPVAHDVDGELGPERTDRIYRVRRGAWCMTVPSRPGSRRAGS